jgi:hypothetical protein
MYPPLVNTTYPLGSTLKMPGGGTWVCSTADPVFSDAYKVTTLVFSGDTARGRWETTKEHPAK